MEREQGIGRRIVSGLLVSLGMALSACQSTEAGAVMAIEEEGDQSRHVVRKIIGGVVMTVLRRPGSRRVSLVIRETQVSPSGRPKCQSPTGRLLTIGNVRTLFREHPGHLRSAMVVTGDPDSFDLTRLVPGECVSVAPDDVDRPETSLQTSITIEASTSLARKEDHLGKGIVELWASAAPARRITAGLKKITGPVVHRVVSSSKAVTALPSHPPAHPA